MRAAVRTTVLVLSVLAVSCGGADDAEQVAVAEGRIDVEGLAQGIMDLAADAVSKGFTTLILSLKFFLIAKLQKTELWDADSV